MPDHARLMNVIIIGARASSYHLGDFTETSGDSDGGNDGDYYVRGVPTRANGQNRLHETHDKQGTNPRQLAYLGRASRLVDWSLYLIALGQRLGRMDCGLRTATRGH